MFEKENILGKVAIGFVKTTSIECPWVRLYFEIEYRLSGGLKNILQWELYF